jgi:hypothetical protein
VRALDKRRRGSERGPRRRIAGIGRDAGHRDFPQCERQLGQRRKDSSFADACAETAYNLWPFWDLGDLRRQYVCCMPWVAGKSMRLREP